MAPAPHPAHDARRLDVPRAPGLHGLLEHDTEPARTAGNGFTSPVTRLGGDRPAGSADAPAAEPDSAPQPLPHGRRVLYIEDEPLNRALMEEVFRVRPQWTLLSADTGAAGLRMAGDEALDLALVDMNLPDTNGLALIGRLRAQPRTQGLRCIALSADAMPEQIAAALAAGFDDYWTKPIDVPQVLHDLGRWLA